jgi:hypothetical protein
MDEAEYRAWRAAMLAEGRAVACPVCNGSMICPRYGECIVCSGFGTVEVSFARMLIRYRAFRGVV